MKRFKIRFITEDDFISNAIRFVTFSEWSHVEIITETGTYLGAHADGGIQERPADYAKVSKERRYEVPVTDEQYDRMMAFAYSKIGTPYNFATCAGMFLRKNFSTKGSEICSMFVFDVLVEAGIFWLNVQPGYTNLVTPEMLHLAPALIGKCVYTK